MRIEYPVAFYHVTSRGNERKAVFKSRRDREKFLSYLDSATERYGAVIHVYCLMDNHYHLLVETPLGNLSKIMQHINGAYTMYFNTKRKRSGHLFQGRYKAILVDAHDPVRYGGTGEQSDWELAAKVKEISPLILAGGLTLDNIQEAIETVSPHAVDINSGTERSPAKYPCIFTL